MRLRRGLAPSGWSKCSGLSCPLRRAGDELKILQHPYHPDQAHTDRARLDILRLHIYRKGYDVRGDVWKGRTQRIVLFFIVAVVFMLLVVVVCSWLRPLLHGLPTLLGNVARLRSLGEAILRKTRALRVWHLRWLSMMTGMSRKYASTESTTFLVSSGVISRYVLQRPGAFNGAGCFDRTVTAGLILEMHGRSYGRLSSRKSRLGKRQSTTHRGTTSFPKICTSTSTYVIREETFCNQEPTDETIEAALETTIAATIAP